MYRTIITCLTLLSLSGCDAEYRYPCQDNNNWNKDICKPPICEINRDCPKYVFEGQPEVKIEQK